MWKSVGSVITDYKPVPLPLLRFWYLLWTRDTLSRQHVRRTVIIVASFTSLLLGVAPFLQITQTLMFSVILTRLSLVHLVYNRTTKGVSSWQSVTERTTNIWRFILLLLYLLSIAPEKRWYMLLRINCLEYWINTSVKVNEKGRN